jgi:hypothetical protein
MTDVVTRLVVRADGSLAVLDQFGKKMSDAGAAADRATGGVARYEAAQRKMQEAQQRGLAISTESIARKTREQRVFEQAASSIDKNYALRIRLEREAERSAVAMSNAVAAGYLRQEQALELLMQQEQQHLALLNRGPGSGSGMSRMTGGMSGLAAQWQDTLVTASMGMPSFMIGLQQGTQVAGQLEMAMQGGASAIEVLGQSFKSLLSPVTLISIALVALVAAGVQMVDWTDLAKDGLNLVADAIVPIAPYAAAAAVGLALLYSPAIISGLVSTVGALGGVAKAIWGIAAAIYATVGLPALLIAGFVAIVAGAVIWRDELTKMLGVDIVGAAQDGINWIIGAFVGGFKGVQVLWATLPAVLGDIAIQAAQSVLDGITTMLNESRTQVLGFLSWVSTLPLPGVNHLAAAGVGALAGAGELTAPQIPKHNAGSAAAVASYSEQAMSDAMATNYLGEVVTFVQGAASGAADALRGLADSMGVDEKASKAAANEAERQAKAYRDLTRDAEQFIAGQHLAAQSLGMSEEAANRLRYEQDMLNKAANDNIKLTAAQRAEIAGLASEMAGAEEATRRLTEIYDLGKEVFGGFFSDLKSGIQDGKTLWESLGNAAANALDKIADKALSMAANGIFDMIFGAVMGGLGGGIGGGTWGVAGGFSGFPGIFGIPGMAEGGTVGRPGLSWVGERGPELLRLPAGAQVIPNAPSMAMAANQNGTTYGDLIIQNTMQVMPGATEEDGAAFARGVSKELRRQLPDAIRDYERNDLRRSSGGR